MMHMTHTTGSQFGFIFLWGLHSLAVLAFLVGLFFLLVWAYKHLSAKQLKQWGLALVIGGALVCFLTISALGKPWGAGNARWMMGNKVDVESKSGNGMGMSMQGMSMMLEGKTGDDFDRAFIQMMIPHHQGAIDMAEDALENAQHEEIKQLARDIIDSQQAEIEQMWQWQRDWGYAE